MYPSLLSHSTAALVLCVLCLQGCGSNFQVTSGNSVLEELHETSNDQQVTHQASVPDVLSSVLSGAPNGRLPTAASATLSSVATSTVRITSPAYPPTVRLDAVFSQGRVFSAELEEAGTRSTARPTAEFSSVSCLTPLHALSPQASVVFGSQEWRRYFGGVGEVPRMPSDINEILDSPCPFWPGKAVKDTHLLVLIPSTVDNKAFTLDLLEELVQSPRGGGHRTQYFLYDDEVQRSSGEVYSSSPYWVLLTRDVLPGSRNQSYTAQQALVAEASHIDHSPYEIPYVLEAATAILSHYVRSGERLYEGLLDDETETPSTSTRCAALLEDTSGHPSPFTVGRFCSRGLVFLSGFDDDAAFGVSCLRKFGTRNYRPSALLHSFGAEEWRRYFGEVEAAPPLPEHIVDTLNSPCPFWLERRVKDTHLLVLIPATVAGKPFSLSLLGELIKHPKGGGYSAKCRVYASDVQERFGAQSPEGSYWVLMTRDVLEGSRHETYESQKALVAHHAGRTGLPYQLPGALEAATVILSCYVRSGERLYTNGYRTYTRCQELVAWNGSGYPATVGGFSPRGIDVFSCDGGRYDCLGVAGLRRV
jgi:hypothetical protein